MLDGAFSMIVIALPIIRLQYYFEGIYLYQELYCGHRFTFSKYLYWNNLKLHHWPGAEQVQGEGGEGGSSMFSVELAHPVSVS